MVVGEEEVVVRGDGIVGLLVEGGSGVPGKDAWDPPEGVSAPSRYAEVWGTCIDVWGGESGLYRRVRGLYRCRKGLYRRRGGCIDMRGLYRCEEGCIDARGLY